jgi:tripartite-type tricarboxylate transporter receptor subunit TctC
MSAMLRRFAKYLGWLLAALIAFPALAQDYPNKPVKIIVPFAAGGPADIYARFLGQRLQDALGQPFVIDDRPGGGSVIGTDAVAKSAPDGYTLLLMSNTQTVNESLMQNKPYALMRDFVPVAPINYSIWCWW